MERGDVEKAINETKEKLFDSNSVVYEFYKTKLDLLNVYLMNYILFNGPTRLDEQSPVFKTLNKTFLLLDRLLGIEEDIENVFRENIKQRKPVKETTRLVDGTVKRPVTEEIMENKPIGKKKVQNNPRKKYKEKNEKMKEAFKPKEVKRID